MLKGKHIILGITGSIAAYKAAYIIRGLVKYQRILFQPRRDVEQPCGLGAMGGCHAYCSRDGFHNRKNGEWHSRQYVGNNISLL